MAAIYADGPITKVETTTTNPSPGPATYTELPFDSLVMEGFDDGNETERTYQLLDGVTEQSGRTRPLAIPVRNLESATGTAHKVLGDITTARTRFWVRVTRGGKAFVLGGPRGFYPRRVVNLNLTADGAPVVLYVAEATAGRDEDLVTLPTA